MGQTLEQLKDTLGLETVNQVRNRVEALGDLLDGSLKRGSKNKIIIEQDGIVILRKLEDLYKSGLTLEDAATQIRTELLSVEAYRNLKLDKTGYKADDLAKLSKDALIVMILQLRELVEELRRQNDFLMNRHNRMLPNPFSAIRQWWRKIRLPNPTSP